MSWLTDLCRDKNKIIKELEAEVEALKFKNDVLAKRAKSIGYYCDKNMKFYDKKLKELEDRFLMVANNFHSEYITKSLIAAWRKEIFHPGNKT